MTKSKKLWIVVILSLVLILGVTAVSAYYVNLPENLSQHETLVFGQSELVPGSQAAMRVAVRDTSDAAPIAAANVAVILKSPSGETTPVFDGITDELGTTNVTFAVPNDEEASAYTLIVKTESKLGSDSVERTVTLNRDYRILLSTDKPLYQPGQQIHMRALALSTFDLTPAANREMEMIIADGKGNTVHRETLTTS